MEKAFKILFLFLLLLIGATAQAQTFTFECKCENLVPPDCDICNTTTQSRFFCGLLVRKNGVAFKWIDAPYIVKWNGQNAIIQEIIPSAETITISRFGTAYGTLDSFKLALDCQCNSPGILWYASDSINAAQIFQRDTVTWVGRDLAHVTFDSLLKKYVIQVDSITGGGSGTVTSVAATAPAAGFTISGSPITVAGTFIFTLADDLAALEALSGTGILVRTAANTYALRTITSGTGISIADGDGVAGNPTITNTSPDQVVSITGAGINVTTGTYPTFTITGTEVDGSTTNELQTFASSSDATSHTITLSSSGGSFKVVEGTGITITTTGTGLDGIATIASTATGTVTSVGLSMPSIFSVSGSPVTTSGTLAATFTTQTANQLFTGPASGGAAIPNFRNMVTDDIQNSIVTYAKVQNVTANRLLGRSNSGGGAMEEITLGTGLSYTGTTLNAAVGISGSGAANQLTYWTGATTVTGSTKFTVDNTNGRVKIVGATAGLGAPNAYLYIEVPIVSSTNALAVSGAPLANINSGFFHEGNTSTNQNTLLAISTGGPNGGDPVLQLNISGTASYALGIDNSDADKFKITPNQAQPGGAPNSGLIITKDAIPLVGINRDAPAHPLDVTGRTRSTTGFMGAFARWAASNIVLGSGAGSGAVLAAHTGTDNALYVSINVGTGPVNNGIIFTGTYPTAWSNVAIVTFSADGTNNSATDIAKFRTGGRTAAKFDFIANGTLSASTNYQFCFSIWGQ